MSSDKVKQAEILKQCGGVDLNLAKSICEKSSIVGAKVIRLGRIQDLKNFIYDLEMDWKFVWVVRDPRALAASQEHAKGDEAEDTCQQMAANLNLLLNPTANWIRNKLQIVRYEGE